MRTISLSTLLPLFAIFAIACGDETSDTAAEDTATDTYAAPEVIYPQSGSWCGDGIEFEVSDGGAVINISYADYGSCSNGGCSSESYVTCEDCPGDIDNEPGEAVFDQSSPNCEGIFDSSTSASGKCSKSSDCGCTMTNYWEASPC